MGHKGNILKFPASIFFFKWYNSITSYIHRFFFFLLCDYIKYILLISPFHFFGWIANLLVILSQSYFKWEIIFYCFLIAICTSLCIWLYFLRKRLPWVLLFGNRNFILRFQVISSKLKKFMICKIVNYYSS